MSPRRSKSETAQLVWPRRTPQLWAGDESPEPPCRKHLIRGQRAAQAGPDQFCFLPPAARCHPVTPRDRSGTPADEHSVCVRRRPGVLTGVAGGQVWRAGPGKHPHPGTLWRPSSPCCPWLGRGSGGGRPPPPQWGQGEPRATARSQLGLVSPHLLSLLPPPLPGQAVRPGSHFQELRSGSPMLKDRSG